MLKVTVFDGRGVRLCKLFDGKRFKCESCGDGSVLPEMGNECSNCGAQVSQVLDLIEGGRVKALPVVLAEMGISLVAKAEAK